MVTPPFKNGALVGDIFSGFPPEVSEAGSRVTGLAIQCFAPAESCNGTRDTNGAPLEFTRTGEGWRTTALSPPGTQFSENTPWLVSVNEGTVLFSMPTGPQAEDEWYARSPGGSFVPIGPATAPGVIGTEPFQIQTILSTAELSHVVWESNGYFWPFDKTTGTASLYEYAGAHNKQPLLVGVTGERGSTELVSDCVTGLGGEHGNTGNRWDALSADGRTVYFTAQGRDATALCANNSGTAPPVTELYARVDGEESDARTVAISQPNALTRTAADEACKSEECQRDITEPANWRDATFLGASEDGSKVFFTSEQQLTDTATQGDNNLYESECTKECEQAGEQRRLLDVSAGDTSGLGPSVQGVVAISADGSHVYFVARGVLSAAPNRQGQSARPGAEDLYVYAEGHTAFIASLPGSDSENWGKFRTHSERDSRWAFPGL